MPTSTLCRRAWGLFENFCRSWSASAAAAKAPLAAATLSQCISSTSDKCCRTPCKHVRCYGRQSADASPPEPDVLHDMNMPSADLQIDQSLPFALGISNLSQEIVMIAEGCAADLSSHGLDASRALIQLHCSCAGAAGQFRKSFLRPVNARKKALDLTRLTANRGAQSHCHLDGRLLWQPLLSHCALQLESHHHSVSCTCYRGLSRAPWPTPSTSSSEAQLSHVKQPLWVLFGWVMHYSTLRLITLVA